MARRAVPKLLSHGFELDLQNISWLFDILFLQTVTDTVHVQLILTSFLMLGKASSATDLAYHQYSFIAGCVYINILQLQCKVFSAIQLSKEVWAYCFNNL